MQEKNYKSIDNFYFFSVACNQTKDIAYTIGVVMKCWYMMIGMLFLTGCYYKKSPEMRLCSRFDWESVVDLFPTTVNQVHQIKDRSIHIMEEMLNTLEHMTQGKTTFHNTVRLYDNAQFKFIMNLQILMTIALFSDNATLRTAADQAVIQLQQYQLDKVTQSPILLQVFRDYAQHGTDDQSKTMQTRDFLKKSIDKLEHHGANLSSSDRALLKKIGRQIQSLQNQFNLHINNVDVQIACSASELQGVLPHHLAQFKLHKDEYLVPLTYDAFFAILENCTNAATRKKIFLAFNNRTERQNSVILKKLLHKRNEYATIIGYANFAQYESAQQMIGSVQKAQNFIEDILEQTNRLVADEFALLTQNLPASVQLTSSGKLEPWDEAFVKNMYRKKQYDLDAAKIAEYFPVSHVMEQLQQQFGQFFALGFDQVSNQGLWDKHLICLRVRLLKTSEIIGYLIFDLYARPGKTAHASQMSVIPTIQDDCNLACSGLSIIATNFTLPADAQEKLLDFHDVKLLLHEFGHGLHELFGATHFVDLAGTKGPRDFVEVPSQLLEMWMENPVMIKLFSQHYRTKQPLSDSLIAKIVASEKFGKASRLQRQCLLSLISLHFGTQEGAKDPHATVKKIYESVRHDVAYCDQDHFEASFDHLITYGSHYYGYVWSQVLAAGLFEYVGKHGITNATVGQKLYTALLSHGGSQDPQMLLEMLLGTTICKKALIASLHN